MSLRQIAPGRPDLAEDAAAEAETLIALGRYELALVSIARGLIVAPTDSRLHSHRAIARYRLGRYRDASCSAGEAISADPTDPWAYDLKASALVAQARTRLPPGRRQLGRQARQAAARAVRLAPEEAQCHCTAAEAELLAGDWPAAYAAARQALELAPDRPEPYVALAQVAVAARDFAAARDAACHGLSVDPTNYAANNQLGTALVGLGHWKQAAVAYAAAARLDPEALPAKRNLARLGGAMATAAALGVMLLLSLAPQGLVLFPLACVTAAVAVGRSARLRRRLSRVGLAAGLGVARMKVGGGLMAGGVLAAAVAAVLAALTLTVGVTVGARALSVAVSPVALGWLMWRGGPALGRRVRHPAPRSDVDIDGRLARGFGSIRRRPLAGASTALIALAGGLGWLVTGLVVYPYLFAGRGGAGRGGAGGRPGGPLVALIPGLIAAALTGVMVRREMKSR